MKRVAIPELLDTDSGTPAEIATALSDLKHINQWFGGISATHVNAVGHDRGLGGHPDHGKTSAARRLRNQSHELLPEDGSIRGVHCIKVSVPGSEIQSAVGERNSGRQRRAHRTAPQWFQAGDGGLGDNRFGGIEARMLQIAREDFPVFRMNSGQRRHGQCHNQLNACTH